MSEISEPGAGVAAPARKRPLRTYGRRSTPSKEPEPPAKRARTETAKSAEPLCVEASPRLPELPHLPKPAPPKRGSIMSYFKPMRSSSTALPDPEPSSDTVGRDSTPPSSPAPVPKSRKRRRLTTRPYLGTDKAKCGKAADDASDNHDETDHSEETTILPEQLGSEYPHETGPVQALSEVAANRINQDTTPPITTTNGKKKKAGKHAAKEKVQTTLSLAMNPGPGFTICKECGVLYNHLNEKDRKEHKKQHAAHVRSKAKRRPASELLV